MPSARAGRADAENRLPRRLFIAVTALGLATYGLSFVPVLNGGDGAGWSIRFAALAALCAAFSLVPSQSPQPLATAALAAMGFLDALSSVFTAEAGWPLTAIVVLNAVQTAAAITALISWPKTRAENTAITGYDAYVDYYNQAVRQYYGQRAPAPHESTERSGYGQASSGAQAAAHGAPRTSQSGDYSDLVAPQGEYGRFAEGPPTGPIRAVPPAGLPSFRPAQPHAAQPEEHPEQSERPSSSP
jgi:hypothetical protein